MIQKLDSLSKQQLEILGKIQGSDYYAYLDRIKSLSSIIKLNNVLSDILALHNNDLNNQILINALMKKNTQLQNDIRSYQQNTNQKIISENIQLSLSIRSLQDANTDLQSQIAAANDVKIQNGKLREENEAMRAQLDKLQAQVDGLVRDVRLRCEKIQCQKQEIIGLTGQVSMLKLSLLDLDEQKQQHVNQREMIQQLQFEVQKSNQTIVELQQDKMQLIDLVGQSTSSFRRYSFSRSAYAEQIDAIRRQLSLVAGENKDLAKSVEILQNNLNEVRLGGTARGCNASTQVVLPYDAKEVQTDAEFNAAELIAGRDYIIERLSSRAERCECGTQADTAGLRQDGDPVAAPGRPVEATPGGFGRRRREPAAVEPGDEQQYAAFAEYIGRRVEGYQKVIDGLMGQLQPQSGGLGEASLIQLVKQLRAQFEMSEEGGQRAVYGLQKLQQKCAAALLRLDKAEGELAACRRELDEAKLLNSKSQAFISSLQSTGQSLRLECAQARRDREESGAVVRRLTAQLCAIYRIVRDA